MQTRSSDKKAACLSVKRVDYDILTKRKKDLSRLLYHTKGYLA